MATCSAGPRCRIACIGACGCIYDHEADACTCECFEDAGITTGSLTLGSVVTVSVKGLPLGAFASRLDRLMTRDVMIPASRVGEKVNLLLKRVPVATAISALGLTTRPAKRLAVARPAARKRRPKARRPKTRE